MLLLIVASGSCRNETAHSPAGQAPPNAAVTVPGPVPTGIDSDAIAPVAAPVDVETVAEPDEADAAAEPDVADPPAEPDEADAVAEPNVADPLAGSIVAAPGFANPLAGCTLCHVDIEDEYVGSTHYDEGVACAKCHGPSEGHVADENNEVKPDELFAREDVDRLCEACHDCSRQIPPEKPPEPKVCTDCHGPHDIAMLQQGSPLGE